jgi:hypothetical protein
VPDIQERLLQPNRPVCDDRRWIDLDRTLAAVTPVTRDRNNQSTSPIVYTRMASRNRVAIRR